MLSLTNRVIFLIPDPKWVDEKPTFIKLKTRYILGFFVGGKQLNFISLGGRVPGLVTNSILIC